MSDFSEEELDAMVDGGSYPISQLMHLLAIFDDLNPTWLLTGQEPMLLRGTPRLRREPAHDPKIRAGKRRHAAVSPPPADPTLPQRVAALELALAELQELIGSRRAPSRPGT